MSRCSSCYKNRFAKGNDFTKFCIECTLKHIKENGNRGRRKPCPVCHENNIYNEFYEMCISCTFKYCENKCYKCGSDKHLINECKSTIPICPDCKQIRILFKNERCITCWETILKTRCKICTEFGHTTVSCKKKKEFALYDELKGTIEEKIDQIDKNPPEFKNGYNVLYYNYDWIVVDEEKKEIFKNKDINELWKFYFSI